MESQQFYTQDVDCVEPHDPEARLKIYGPFVSGSLTNHARYSMLPHTAEKGVASRRNDGGAGSGTWWSFR